MKFLLIIVIMVIEEKNQITKGGIHPMAIIPYKSLFDYTEIEKLGDLKRLKLAIEYLPDEKLMKHLEKERGYGRNDYPIRGMWNSLLAGIVYQHDSIESLRRELARNGQLRQLCGLSNKVPSPWAYSRFLTKLMKKEHMEYIDDIFNYLIAELKELLPDFGERLAIDGKAIESYANSHKYENEKELKGDRRRDLDADYGVKKYSCEDKNGNRYEKIKSWFGYKLHLVVDAVYELPVAYEVTEASRGEEPIARKLLDEMADEKPDLLKDCEVWLGDKGYDDTKFIKILWDKYGIKPVIDIRNMWQEDKETKLLEGEENIVYDHRGNVFCFDPKTGVRRKMSFGGFEKDRKALKQRCPAKYLGIECEGREECPVNDSIRIPLKEDRRVFTPIARQSYKWDRIYKSRTAVERVNSRLDVSFGLENHTIRGIKKMRLHTGLSLMVMLAMAVGRIKEKQKEKMRSLVKPA